MIIGIPKEIKDNEYRIAVTPGGVEALVQAGHSVYVQSKVDQGSTFGMIFPLGKELPCRETDT